MSCAGLRSGPKTGHWVLPGETRRLDWGRFAPQRRASLLTTKSEPTTHHTKPAHHKKQTHHTQPAPPKKHSHHKYACSPQPAREGSIVEVNRLFAVSLYLNGEHNLCGEQACPALSCEAALKPASGFCLEKRGDWIGAASRPSAGQACSLQKANSPHTAGSPQKAQSPHTTHRRLPPKSTATTNTPALLNQHEWGRLLR